MAQMNKKDLLLNIQAVGILAIDLHLFLDTHPEDVAALEEYTKVNAYYRHLKNEYEKHYGPLTSSGTTSFSDQQKWVNDPWPWKRQ